VHIGTGEIFSLSKSFAWRWDFSNVQYKARVENVSTKEIETRSMSDLYLGIGLTVLFPGARYR
jgi:hypothetical protein